MKRGVPASPLNLTLCCFSFTLQASWINVDFDNWRDWEHEEDEGKEEYDRYMDVSKCSNSSVMVIMIKSLGNRARTLHYSHNFSLRFCKHLAFLFQVIQELATSNKGQTPDMDDLSDVSAVLVEVT